MSAVEGEREFPTAGPEHALVPQVFWAGDDGPGEVAAGDAREGGVGEETVGVGGVGGVDLRGVDSEEDASWSWGRDWDSGEVQAVLGRDFFRGLREFGHLKSQHGFLRGKRCRYRSGRAAIFGASICKGGYPSLIY